MRAEPSGRGDQAQCGESGDGVRRPERRLDDEQREAHKNRRGGSAEDQPRPGKRQIELGMGEDLRELRGGRKHDRLAQRLAHRVIDEGQPGAQRQHDKPDKQRPPGRETQPPRAKRNRRDIEQ